MKKVVLLSFADRKMSPTLAEIKREAKQSSFFDEIHLFNEHKLDADFLRKFGEWINENSRGFGYWIWKPYLIFKELSNLNTDDILVYLDAGCIINPLGQDRLKQYLELIKDKSIICFEHSNCYEYQYDKKDFLEEIGLANDMLFLHSRQKMSGIIMFRKCDSCVNIVRLWLDFMTNNLNLIDDSPSNCKEIEGFVEHRRDQSVFSAYTWNRKDVLVLSQKEVYQNPCDSSTMAEYPFWAARRKLYKRDGLVDRIINRALKLINARKIEFYI